MPTTDLPITATPHNTTTGQRFSTTGGALTMTAADVANGNHIDTTANVTVIAHNTGGSAYTVTVTSAAESASGRTGDVSAQSLAAGEIRAILLQSNGWSDSNGQYLISASNAAVEFGVMAL